MKSRAHAATATALALIMAAPHATAFPQPVPTPLEAARVMYGGAHVLLAQAEQEEELSEEEELLRQLQQEEDDEGEDEEAEPTPDEGPVPEEAPATDGLDTDTDEEPPVDESEPTPDEGPAPEEAPATDDLDTDTDEEPPVDEPEPTPDEGPVPEEAPATDDLDPTTDEEPPVDDPEPTPDEGPVPEEAPATDDGDPVTEEEPLVEEPEPTPDEGPVPEGSPATDDLDPTTDEEPLVDEPEPTPDEGPVPGEAPATDDGDPATEGEPLVDEPPLAEDAAPILDSEKEDPSGEAQPGAVEEEPAEAGPPPASDEEAQQEALPAEIFSVREEEGRRVERREERRERREGTDVLREIGDRIIIQLSNQIIVQSDDRGRIGRDASEVYYEELPRGRVRETVVRPNGVQVVTIYDRYGDVIRRSRIMPDGREYVLVYADRRGREDMRDWRDPGLDLPPLRLRIPVSEYILDAGRVSDADAYYDFFNRPPVEPVRRLYTIDEVRYSARVRDSVRRIELDTITFDFGAASIAESEIWRLEAIAEAMHRLLDGNPAESFLIEGHTDAVGSDEANLALSDRRAEAVAMALTNVFDIPPESLVTQGYGKRYLKIDTQEPERANRRVVMRRITPLVAPVAGLQ